MLTRTGCKAYLSSKRSECVPNTDTASMFSADRSSISGFVLAISDSRLPKLVIYKRKNLSLELKHNSLKGPSDTVSS